MKGNMNNVYSSNTSKLANLLNFSDGQFNTDLDASQESQDYEVDGEINDQDGDEEVSV